MKSFYTLLLIFSSFIFSYSQIGIPGMMEEEVFPFERVYPTQTDNHSIADIDSLGSGFITLGQIKNLSTDSTKHLNVISFDKKGNINWTNEYKVPGELQFRPTVGDVEVLEDDSIAFVSLVDSAHFQYILTKIGTDGGYGWSKRIGIPDVDDEAASVAINSLGTTNLILTINNSFPGLESMQYVVILDLSGEIISSQLVEGDIEFVDATNTTDSTLAILIQNDESFGVIEIDSMGSQVRSFAMSNSSEGLSYGINEITVLANGDYALIGHENSSDQRKIRDVLLRYTKQGKLVSTFGLGELTGSLDVNKVAGTPDSAILISGTYTLNGETTPQPFVSKIAQDSTVEWSTYSYFSFGRVNAMLGTADGGSIMFLNGGRTDSEQRMATPYLIRYDKDGNRNDLCSPQSLRITLDSIAMDSVAAPEITFTDKDIIFQEIELEAKEYVQFSPPTLSLPDTMYCPQDEINFPMDATVMGGVRYEWQKDMEPFSREPMVVATEEGMYTARVDGRNDEMITCWTLCDTTNITVKDEPMVTIEPDFTRYCESGEAILTAMSNNFIQTIEWSTGNVGDTRIAITEPGDYSVTVVDDCGLSATATYSPRNEEFEVMLPLELDIDDTFCSTGTVRVTLGDFRGDPDMLSWSNGESGATFIEVTEPGTYSVELDGFCTGMAEIDVSESFFTPDGSISINSDCGVNQVTLTAVEDEISSREWSTGATSISISVNEVGEYTLTGFDLCGDPLEPVTINVTQEDLDNCGVEPPEVDGDVCLEFPNAFVPNSRREINREFKPKLKDECMGAVITDYQFRIYNRWGNEVFSTNVVDQGWFGTRNGKESPADVYYFYAEYKVDGNDAPSERGDVTLIR